MLIERSVYQQYFQQCKVTSWLLLGHSCGFIVSQLLGFQMRVTANSSQLFNSSSNSIYMKSFMCNNALQAALPGLTLL